jgi:hypothetical protein
MSSGGGGKTQTATTTSEPPKYLQPFLQQGMQGAQSLYQQGPQQYYPGQTVVGFSPETEQALGMQTQRATTGSPVMGAANQFAANTLGGEQPLTFGGATNPHLDATFNRGADQIMNRLKTDFAGSGRNTGAAMPVAGEQLGSFANDLYGGDYQNERNRMAAEIGQNQNAQLSVLGMAPGLAQADYNDIDRLSQVGQAREDLTGREYEDAANRWDFGQNAQGTALDQYLSRLQGYPGGVASSSTPIYRNQSAGALGGAMAGYQLGNQFGYGGYGALAGGLLGMM